MKILVNDDLSEKERYEAAFRIHNYEEHSLIYCSSFQETKEFIEEQLERKQHHIDLIVTGSSAFSRHYDDLKASELLFFKNELVSAYSQSNFRICGIPIILYSDTTGQRRTAQRNSYSAIVEKNMVGDHQRLVSTVEKTIKNWRKNLLDDLENLGLDNRALLNFTTSSFYHEWYLPTIAARAETYFALRTQVVSLGFIRCPNVLSYDWLLLNSSQIEMQLEQFGYGFRNHRPYNRKLNDTEDTIIHPLLKDNPVILKRGRFRDFLHERKLPKGAGGNEQCDFIMLSEVPDYIPTVFFEVKTEKVKYLTLRNRHLQFTADMNAYLRQVWRYKRYAENPKYQDALSKHLGYSTNKFAYELLAGRGEEKLRREKLLKEMLEDHYSGVVVWSFEDLEKLGENYLNLFIRTRATT